MLIKFERIDRIIERFQLGPFLDERSSYVQNLQEKTYEQIFNETLEKIKR